MAEWKIGTLVESKMVAENIKSLKFSLPGAVRHMAGQHYDLRLTAENGYSAERSYSLANSPSQGGVVEFGIQLLENGEVSPYLYQMSVGDQLEMRGPIGGHFVWDTTMPGPLVLIGGGSGCVPLMAMLRHHEDNFAKDSSREVIFLISSRTLERTPYYSELLEWQKKDKNFKLFVTLTDSQPEGWPGYNKRIDTEILKEVLSGAVDKMPMVYICGPTPFVEATSGNLVSLGFNPHEIRTERFGGA